MKNKNVFLVFAFVLVQFLGIAQTIDAEKSIVNFKIANLSFSSVEGTIKGMKGSLHFDVANLTSSSFDVCIDPSTIETGINKRDKHLKTEDFFFVEKYPTICFKSLSITKTATGYETEGNLTLHGVTKKIKIPFVETTQDGKKVLTGKFTVNRFDYNLGSEAYSGTFVAGKDVEVEIICFLK